MKGLEPRDDPILQGKKDVETGFRVELGKRNIPPSNTQVCGVNPNESCGHPIGREHKCPIVYRLQLYMLRSMLESLVDKSAGKKAPRKDLDSQHVQAIENFLKVSFYWTHLIDFTSVYRCQDFHQEDVVRENLVLTLSCKYNVHVSVFVITGTLQSCCDLSQFWYREFYLEMTLGKRIQVSEPSRKSTLAQILCLSVLSLSVGTSLHL